MAGLRSPYQGVWNIVRFNWHFYAVALVVGIFGILCALQFGSIVRLIAIVVVLIAAIQIAVSLWISHLIYDRSDLYDLSVIGRWDSNPTGLIVNIHAGFDETSSILRDKFPNANFAIWDFYNSEKHTEISIRRAREIYPPDPKQIQVDTIHLPCDDAGADMVCLILAAHEIRSLEEQRLFFSELHRILKPDGKIVVIEHLRDAPNFFAFSAGFLHFFPRERWQRLWGETNFKLESEEKITPFLSAFLLSKR